MTTANGDYTAMAEHYDEIMGEGYYDYEAIGRNLAAVEGAERVLEVGVGTGRVLEYMLKFGSGYTAVTGIDRTPGMVAQVPGWVAGRPGVHLHVQDVTELDLEGGRYDLAFSYGGVWYFVPDGDSHAMISHIRDDGLNLRGLRRVADHLRPAGRFLLGIQGAHSAYSRTLSTGAIYEQQLAPLKGGFRKRYLLTRPGSPGQPVVDQVTDYRVYPWEQAAGMLAQCGLTLLPPEQHHGPLFLEFTRA